MGPRHLVARSWGLALCAGFSAGCGHSFDPQAPPLPPEPPAGVWDLKPPAAAFQGCPSGDTYSLTAAERESAFARLTATPWETARRSLSIGRDGAFAWQEFVSDYFIKEGGRWNFDLSGPDSGAIFTSTGSMIPFDIGDGTLGTSLGAFRPGDAATSAGSLAALPPVEPPWPYRELAGTCWRPANDFGVAGVPDRLSFPTPYRFVLGFDGRGCEESAGLSVFQGQHYPFGSAGSCGPGTEMELGRPDMVGGLLLTYQGTLRPLSDPSDEKVFVFDSWGSLTSTPFRAEGATSGGSVRVTGRYLGDWTQGVATNIAFELTAVAAVGARLGKFTLVLQRFQLPDDPASGYLLIGDPDYHELADFNDEHLAALGTRRFDIELVPAVAGEYVLASFKLGLKLFSGESLDNIAGYSARIAEGTPIAPTPVPTPDDPTTARPPSYSSCGMLDTEIQATSLAFSPDGALLAVGAYDADAEVQLWNVWTRDLRLRVAGGGKSTSSTFAAFAGNSLVRAHTTELDLFSLADGQLTSNLVTGTDRLHPLGRPSVSPDGRWMALPHDQALEIWSTDTWRPVHWLRIGDNQERGWGVFSPAGPLAAPGLDFAVSLLDPGTGRVIRELVDHTDLPICAAFGEEGRLLVTGAMDETLVLWNTDDGSIRRRLDAGNFLRDCALAPDGTLVALLDLDLTLFRTDVESSPLVLPGHDKTMLAVSPDGSRIAAGGFDFVELFCRDSVDP